MAGMPGGAVRWITSHRVRGISHTPDRQKDRCSTATGLPLLGGLVTSADLKRGSIDHALALSLVETAKATWAWPAQRTDGWTFTSNINPIPERERDSDLTQR